MSRPKNKNQLLTSCQENFETLNEYVESLSDAVQQQTFPKGTLNRNIRDVLAHLHHWHLLMLEWYEVGMRGEKPEMPAKGYTWKTTPELNIAIRERYVDISLADAKQELEQSHASLQNLIRKHTDEELFQKKRYKWTGSTSLGAYLISATSSHYDWALKLIKRATKA